MYAIELEVICMFGSKMFWNRKNIKNLLSVCRSFSQLSAQNRGQVERLVLRVLTIAFLHQSSFASLRQRLILSFADTLLSGCMVHEFLCQRVILSFADTLLSVSLYVIRC